MEAWPVVLTCEKLFTISYLLIIFADIIIIVIMIVSIIDEMLGLVMCRHH